MYLYFNCLDFRCWRFECLKRPSLAVMYAYTSMCLLIVFEGIKQYIPDEAKE